MGCISAVNLPLRFSSSALFIGPASAENEGHSALPVLLTEYEACAHLLPVANFPPMNITQMHERLRLELLRRIQRGSLSVSLLARQTGFGQAHISNFIRGRRQLSLDAMDRILAAQHLTAADLLPVLSRPGSPLDSESDTAVPVVSHAAALFEPHIRISAVQWMWPLRSQELLAYRTRVSQHRRAWQRFVAVVLQEADALPMDPLLLPSALVLIDRHYTSLMAYNHLRPNLYAVRQGAHLVIRYVDFTSGRLLLRPHNLAYPVELIEVDPDESPSDLLAGRIAMISNQP